MKHHARNSQPTQSMVLVEPEEGVVDFVTPEPLAFLKQLIIDTELYEEYFEQERAFGADMVIVQALKLNELFLLEVDLEAMLKPYFDEAVLRRYFLIY